MGYVNDEFLFPVLTAELLAALKDNRRKHAKAFKTAQAAYKEACLEDLEERVSEIEAGGVKPSEFVRFDLVGQAPQDFTAVYDDAIAMMEMCAEAKIEITNRNFRAWVQDRWDWSDRWANSVMTYTVS